jgi:hypothetical protein
MLLDLAAFMK